VYRRPADVQPREEPDDANGPRRRSIGGLSHALWRRSSR
jgi:hypothetical protein